MLYYALIICVVAIVRREDVDTEAVEIHVPEHIYYKGFLPAVGDGLAEHL